MRVEPLLRLGAKGRPEQQTKDSSLFAWNTYPARGLDSMLCLLSRLRVKASDSQARVWQTGRDSQFSRVCGHIWERTHTVWVMFCCTVPCFGTKMPAGRPHPPLYISTNTSKTHPKHPRSSSKTIRLDYLITSVLLIVLSTAIIYQLLHQTLQALMLNPTYVSAIGRSSQQTPHSLTAPPITYPSSLSHRPPPPPRNRVSHSRSTFNYNAHTGTDMHRLLAPTAPLHLYKNRSSENNQVSKRTKSPSTGRHPCCINPSPLPPHTKALPLVEKKHQAPRLAPAKREPKTCNIKASEIWSLFKLPHTSKKGDQEVKNKPATITQSTSPPH